MGFRKKNELNLVKLGPIIVDIVTKTKRKINKMFQWELKWQSLTCKAGILTHK